ncbi:chromatin target of PRMT1 protein-like [Macrosteles quadrilineatus]|uniref:chromatin target of PRMT1 protein-like n=1 Tax=Macrosteles quadrilineatus TaxID=74068 RepID=UPI0023E13B61|nr:chromatin target of PRMT1 protein-like [Macrosteles quadrilineatus]
MSLKKIIMKSSTRMSLHERFTFLRSQSATEPSGSVHVASVRQGLFSDQQSSLKNRRLAQMMDRRPTVVAALKLKKRILRQQRIGQMPGARVGLSVKDRLSLRGRGGLRGRVGPRNSTGRSPLVRLGTRGGRGNMSRSQSMTNLSRSQSVQSLSGRHNNMISRGRGGVRFQNRNTYTRRPDYWRSPSGGGGRGRGLRARGGGFNRNRDDFRTQRGRGRFNTRSQRSRGFRGRGGQGRGGRGPPPTREELDSQLDQYMASSRGVLDQDLDSYMTGQQEESWD